MNHADKSTIETREALDALGVKCRSGGLTAPVTPVGIIALTSEVLDVRASSSTA